MGNGSRIVSRRNEVKDMGKECFKRNCYNCFIFIFLFLLILIVIFDFCYHDLIESIIGYFNVLIAFALCLLAYIAKDDWQKKIKRNNFENAKKNLINSIIDCVQTFKTHCYEDPTLSEITEMNAEASEGVCCDEIANRREIYNIDIEFTRKIRDLNRNFELFEFYYDNRNTSSDLEQIKKFKQKIIDWSRKVRVLDVAKFRFYLHTSGDNNFDKFQDKLIKIQQDVKEVSEDYQKIKSILKNIQ